MHFFKRRRTVAAIALVALAGSVVACSSNDAAPAGSPATSSGEQVAATIGLTYIPNVQFAPAYVADADGALGDGVSLRHHGQNEGLFTALLSGREQFVVAGADEAATAASDELLVVSPYYETFPVTVSVKADSDIHSMADLKGKKVGIAGHYGEGWYGLLVGLHNAGLTPEDIDVQEVGYTQQAALAGDKVDAVVGFINNDAVQMELRGMDVHNLDVNADDSLRSASVITTKKFASEHPETVKQVVAGFYSAYAKLKADPSVGVEAAQKLIPELSEPEQLKAAKATMDATAKLLPGPDTCAELTEESARKMVEALKDVGIEGIQVDGSDLYSTQYCP